MHMALPKFATKTGDAGETSLWSGERVPKSDPRIVLNAEIDLALSALGRGHRMLRDHPSEAVRALEPRLLNLQRRFIALMGEIVTAPAAQDDYRAKHDALTEEDLAEVDALYQSIHAAAGKRRGSLAKWQLYGEKGAAAAEFYFIRATFRRAELTAWATTREFPIRPLLLQILNRCGDLFFALALLLEEVD